jgi:hypothetical protein
MKIVYGSPPKVAQLIVEVKEYRQSLIEGRINMPYVLFFLFMNHQPRQTGHYSET